jgi:uncharacterized HAD superfamily protein/adenine/guanine phosphoribosyltransferase-like PRPP-binding protein
MRYVNYYDLAHTITMQRRRMPPKIDLVVGIPRSGMVPATIVATQMNIPMTDPDGLVADRLLGVGNTKGAVDLDRALAPDRTVLVMDDVIGSGRAIRELKERFAAAGVRGEIVYCAVYGPQRRHPDVDLVLDHSKELFLSQWNVMFHPIMERSCVDIDGVLCANPGPHEDDDGRYYKAFLTETPVLFRTNRRIGALVTSRRERYRRNTIDWLARHGIEYHRLLMMPDDATEDSAKFKADMYVETDSDLFIESEADIADRIAKLSGRPVLCTETQLLGYPNGATAAAPLRRSGMTMRRRASNAKLVLRRQMGDRAYYFLKRLAGR